MRVPKFIIPAIVVLVVLIFQSVIIVQEINQAIVQIGNSKDMIYSFDYIISYISKFYTLRAGDLIFTGTPSGVGQVKIGDKLEGYIFEEKMLHN